MSEPNEWYTCLGCHSEFPQTDARVVEFLGIPPEYEHRCPDCNSINLQEQKRIMCDACGEVQVSDEGERCNECHAEWCEYLADVARGH